MTAVDINVGDTETATVNFFDEADNPTTAPEGAVITVASSNPDVLTVTARPDDPVTFDLTVVAVGDADLSATVADVDGNPLFPVDTVPVHVDPGGAVSARITVAPA